ncbi:hypothetical protein [Pseudomonas sp. B35(2017)]|uniref:hypothetical protein n=1 Tax=Pseudomonas sp. B35(2017) TaxID=1981722 RepID=UPI00111C284C|nr:hypothetical protein [Pseudomonas sp. B35(2017)]
MRITVDGLTFSPYDTKLIRGCAECKKQYSIRDYFELSEHHFYTPVNYKNGCERKCLECWLGVTEQMDPPQEKKRSVDIEVSVPDKHEHWYDRTIYCEIDQADLSAAYSEYLHQGCHLAILPLSRLITDRSIFLPRGVMIYPVGRLDLKHLKLEKRQLDRVASSQISASGVRLGHLGNYPLLVIPLKFSWEQMRLGDHEAHMDMIVKVSELVDGLCYDFINYLGCRLEHLASETKPALPGQLASKSMMSAAVLVKSDAMDSVLLAGAAFSQINTKGLGLDLRQPEWDQFPKDGEVGKIATHALSLYSQMLQTQSATSKFVQALSLIEFLAFPDECVTYKKVKTVVSRYMVEGLAERKRILDRFECLTGKKDEITGEEIGFRTRIVHIGARLEQLVKTRSERQELFAELDGYIRTMIDHMIEHSHLSSADYEVVKSNM